MKRVLLCVVMVAWSSMASAVVYKWIDAQGKLQYGDRPPVGVHAEVVEMPGNHATPSAPERPAAAPPAAPATAPPLQSSTQNDSDKNTVASDVAQTRDKQCADAQDRYKKLIEGRRLYKAGADGERQYLTSEEIDAERLSAKHDIDTICNSPT